MLHRKGRDINLHMGERGNIRSHFAALALVFSFLLHHKQMAANVSGYDSRPKRRADFAAGMVRRAEIMVFPIDNGITSISEEDVVILSRVDTWSSV